MWRLEDTENFFRDLELLKLGRTNSKRGGVSANFGSDWVIGNHRTCRSRHFASPRFLPFLSDKSVSEEIKTQTEEVSKRLDTLTRQMAGLIDRKGKWSAFFQTLVSISERPTLLPDP